MRTRVILKAGVFALAALVTATGLSITATNTNVRADLTLARRHQITDRTRARLRALEAPVELVVAVARDRLDPRDADRVDDVLAALDAASPRFAVTMIDVTGPRGPERYEDLVARLEARDTRGAGERAALAETVRRDAGTLQWDLASLDASATAAAQAASGTDPALSRRLGEFAAFARVAARKLNEALGADSAQADPVALVRAAADLAGTLVPQFQAMQDELGAMEPPARARPQIGESARLAATLRARAASLAEVSPPTTDLDRVAEALATGEAALLIGPVREDGGPGVVALDLDSFYPPPERAALERTGEADARVRAEQLVASGLAVLTDRARPIVVFLHGEPQRFVGQVGVLNGLLQRLADAGIDHAEWPVVLDESPPDLAALDPAGERPVVYAVISPDSAAASIPGNAQSRPGTERAATVARAVSSLIERGEPVLLGMNPLVFPTFGDTDPIAGVLGPLGVRVDSASPILSSANTTLGPTTAWDMRLVPTLPADARDEANPIAVAINGLPLAMEWPLPISSAPADERAAGTRIDALVTLDIPDAWSESEWLGYWRTPRAQRPLLRDPPVFDDGTDDARGPFTVAVAIEHAARADGSRARIVAVGSNTWFLDRMWQARQAVAGRGVLTNPGNPELFDAAVLWLAGREELIAPSPQARPVARIEPISPGRLGLLRWGLIGGMPLGILLVGGAWRLLRG